MVVSGWRVRRRAERSSVEVPARRASGQMVVGAEPAHGGRLERVDQETTLARTMVGIGDDEYADAVEVHCRVGVLYNDAAAPRFAALADTAATIDEPLPTGQHPIPERAAEEDA